MALAEETLIGEKSPGNIDVSILGIASPIASEITT
jgi:hypothetical protein